MEKEKSLSERMSANFDKHLRRIQSDRQELPQTIDELPSLRCGLDPQGFADRVIRDYHENLRNMPEYEPPKYIKELPEMKFYK